MRVLLDENVPFDVAQELPDHDVVTVRGMGWAGLKNGQLLRRAAGQCDAFLTFDSNIEYQQPLAILPFGVVVVRPHSSRMTDVLPLMPAVRMPCTTLAPGEVRHVLG